MEIKLSKEFIIYCDESDQRGQFFSNFYGGAIVRSEHINYVNQTLIAKKVELNLLGEIKWTKITENYQSKYIELMKCFFHLIQQDLIKVRVMFTKNEYVPVGLTQYHHDNKYYLLYYQFIKKAFGLAYTTNEDKNRNIRIYLDEFPDTKEKQAQFKDFLGNLSKDQIFREKKLVFTPENITHVSSHSHVILQCVDVVLGAICFRLNDRHKVIPDGKNRRAKRTIAKEKVYKEINKLIRAIIPNFNIGTTTSVKMDPLNYWKQSYRHWMFIPKNHELDKTKAKRSKKITPLSLG